MDTLQGVLTDIRVFLYSGIQSLPLALAGTMLILGLFTANYAMLFFLVGFLVCVPFTHFITNILFQAILPDSYLTKSSDVCNIIIPFLNTNTNTDVKYLNSQWMAMVAFFFGYMIHNSVKLLKRPPESTRAIEVTEKSVKEMDRKASYRKTQAIVSMISMVIVACAIIIVRWTTGCENIIGFILGVGGYGTLGYVWYHLLSLIGEDRLSDLFGIANRLLSPGAIANGPVVCLPVPEENVN